MLRERIMLGYIVVAREQTTQTFFEGRGSLDMPCVCDGAGGVIRKATFAGGLHGPRRTSRTVTSE